jgi:hypothetical protein
MYSIQHSVCASLRALVAWVSQAADVAEKVGVNIFYKLGLAETMYFSAPSNSWFCCECLTFYCVLFYNLWQILSGMMCDIREQILSVI